MDIQTLKTKLSGGVAPAMATPLLANSYRVNTAVIPRLVDFLLEKGVCGLFVGGTTGEGILLDAEEREKLHAATLAAVNGRVPVLLHVGAQRTETAVALAQHAAANGADALAAVPPTFYGMHDDALAAYFQAVAAAAPRTPLFLYDIPQMAVNGVSPALAARLSRTLPTLAGMKSSRGDVQAVRALIDALPPDKILLAGNESAALGLLALGADGLISGLSTAVPEPFVELTRAFAAGDLVAARRAQRVINALLPLLPAGARIGAIKSLLRERGVDVGTAVPTLPTPDAPLWPAMQAVLAGQALA